MVRYTIEWSDLDKHWVVRFYTTGKIWQVMPKVEQVEAFIDWVDSVYDDKRQDSL